jgi:DNA mismatch repair ATPase MutL
MRQRIVNIFSGKTNENWFRSEETEIVTIHGFVVSLNLLKKTGEQFFFVNDRFIKAVICIMRLWLLTMAFETAHNLVIFYLTVPPNTIDQYTSY